MLSKATALKCPQCDTDQLEVGIFHMMMPESKDGPRTFAIAENVVGRALSADQAEKLGGGRHFVIEVRCGNGHEFKMLFNNAEGKLTFREDAYSFLKKPKPEPEAQVVEISMGGNPSGEALGKMIGHFFSANLETAAFDALWSELIATAKKKAPLLVQWLEVGTPEFAYQEDGFRRLFIINYEKQHEKVAEALRLHQDEVKNLMQGLMRDPTIALEIKVA